jgi:hypothetical protein
MWKNFPMSNHRVHSIVYSEAFIYHTHFLYY